jgi:tetratricopeptide (TPR) repeat protein
MAAVRMFAIIVLALAGGSLELRADDTSTCYMTNSNDWMNPEKYDAAMRACDRLISSRSGSGRAAAYRARGYWKNKKGNSESALADLNAAIQLEPRNVESYFYRGEIFKGTDQFDRALADFEMVTRIDPTFAAAYYYRGHLYEKKGDYAAARKEYNQALAAPSGGINERLTDWAKDRAREGLATLPQ